MEEASSILDVLQLLAQWEHTWYSSYGEAQGLSEQKKIKDGGPCANEDANLPHIHWKFCLPCLQDTDHSIYTYNDSRLFSRSYGVLSNCTEEWNNHSTSCPWIFRFPQLLAMSPATFWATFFLASGEIGESPIYMSKKASAHQTRISLVKCERGTSHKLICRFSFSTFICSGSRVQGKQSAESIASYVNIYLASFYLLQRSLLSTAPICFPSTAWKCSC